MGGWYRAEHTRHTGVKVVRSHNRYWDFPICGRCEEWREAEEEAGWAYTSFTTAKICSVVGFVVGGLMAFVGGLAVGSMLLTRNGPNACSSACSLSILAFGVASCFLAYSSYVKIEPLKKKYERLQDDADDIRPAGAASTEPVDYHGWYGTVHEFTFHNDDFGCAFARLNASKVVR
jgi:hypothetical protein